MHGPVSPRTAIRFAAFEYQPSRRRLLIDGQPAKLGARAIDLLHALIERRDRTVRKAELLDLVWPDVVVEEANLHVQVSALRKVLGDGVIATVPGRGYRFVAALDGEGTAGPRAATVGGANAGNLPNDASVLIGRDEALAALSSLLREEPVVTITGSGGVGKSRLALAAAHQLDDRHADGAWLVDAATVEDPQHLASAVAQVLRITLHQTRDAACLAAALADRSMLLVLDNCEHVASGARDLVDALRESAPAVRVLTTSQVPLGCAGEKVMRLEPLALPHDGAAASEAFGAIALFVARARAAQEGFALHDENASVVADICRQLDGLPLAIELAAARVRLLGVNALRDRLVDRLRLLTSSGRRNASPRQQTLRAALEWSHGLLDENERTLLRRLGVFVGGITLELAQEVASDEEQGLDAWAVLDHLGTLIDKSLVSVSAGEPVRYRLLETVRAFALEQLGERGERDALRTRHARAMARYYAELDEARCGDAGTMPADDVMPRQGSEIDNARAALDWSFQSRDWPTAVTLAGASAGAFFFVGRVHEIVARMRALLPHLGSATPIARTALLSRLGSMGTMTDMPRDELHSIKLQAVDEARKLGHRRRRIIALSTLAAGLISRDELETAQLLADEMKLLGRDDDPPIIGGLRLAILSTIHIRRHELREAATSLGQQRLLLIGMGGDPVALAPTELNLSGVLNTLQRHAEALEVSEAGLARPGLPRGFAAPLAYQRLLALSALGRVDEAADFAAAQRQVFERSGSVFRYGCEALATLSLARGRLDDATRIEAALLQYIGRVGGERHPLTSRLGALLEEARRDSAVPAETIDQWRAEGAALTESSIFTLVLGKPR